MRRAVALLAAAALGGASAGAAQAQATAPSADFTCTPGPADCSGWREGDVQLKWFWPAAVEATKDCDFRTLTAEGVHEATCGVLSAGTWTYTTATVRIDRTAPQATGVATDRPPDAEGWFNRPVGLSFTGADTASGIAGCTTLSYAGPDGAAVPLTGSCRDGAGRQSAPLTATLRYDDTPPRITAARPERPPDHAGWYTRPVTFSFSATDALSGVAACPTATLSGPDGALARLTGTCADRAGNVVNRAYTVRYDATAPRLRDVAGEPGDGSVRLTWRLPADARAVRRHAHARPRPRAAQRRPAGPPRGAQRPRPAQRADLRVPRHGDRRRGQRRDAHRPAAPGPGAPGAAQRDHRPPPAAAALDRGARRALLQRPALSRRAQGAQHVAARAAPAPAVAMALRRYEPHARARPLHLVRLARHR